MNVDLIRAREYHTLEMFHAAFGGPTMPNVKDSREGYVVFRDNGDLLYDGHNKTVARLVAGSCNVAVY